ncbi:FAD-dependent oxidoreductase [Haloarcula marina]|uniref:FAD-dependent oxidoreductase n=1 Tax=Haloarcula marina TaxID=2961574 RepID=UPI0020B700C7|nr:FAD-dependent oxidoreductase [Halomicroarcula marina]
MNTDNYDVVVVGATPGGIAAAVRTARENLETLLVAYNQHLGGMMTGGLSYTDTLTTKARAPLLKEFFSSVREHYLETYGKDSQQFEYCENGYIFEPHVAEQTFEELVDEPSLTIVRGYHPSTVERDGKEVTSAEFEPFDGEDDPYRVTGDVFIEGTYEGDLMATAGAEYRIGRESRSEYDEQFAGRIFTQMRGDRYYPIAAVGDGDDSASEERRGPLDVPPEKCQGELDLIPHPAGLTEIYPETTGVGDDAIQAYNYRLCLSNDPENRRLPDKPEGYDRIEYLSELEDIEESGLGAHIRLRKLPNDKADLNTADLPGENHDYPEADWEKRSEIEQEHRKHVLGLLYFLQNDDEVPDDIQADAREWGLAADEFTDNDNFPWQLYVREARRLEGRETFTENDARHAPDLDRAPIYEHSVAIAEYPLDSHACNDETQAGSRPEGFFFASQVTRPAQLPYETLLPKGIDNLLVPVPLSATHVAYGTVRLEPTWMHIGESAGVAATIALQSDEAPASIDRDHLRRRLVDSDVMISFFNECDMATEADWLPAVQYLGTEGYFTSYDARPDDALDHSTAKMWAERTANLAADEACPATAFARELENTDEANDSVTETEFLTLLKRAFDRQEREDTGQFPTTSHSDGFSRGDACELIVEVLESTTESPEAQTLLVSPSESR